MCLPLDTEFLAGSCSSELATSLSAVTTRSEVIPHTPASEAATAHADPEDGHRRPNPAFATNVFPDLQAETALAKSYGSPESRAGAGLEQPPGRAQPQLCSFCCGSHPQKDQHRVISQVGAEGEDTEVLPSPKIPAARWSISRLPGTALLPGCSSSPLHSHRDAGQVSMPRAGMSHAPPGHAASILCKPLAPFKQALKLRLISPVSLWPRSMENALSGDSASPRATTSHQAKPSMQ